MASKSFANSITDIRNFIMALFGSKYKKTESKGVCAVIVAAGSGSRMGCSGTSKIMLELLGRPVISYTLRAYEAAESIDSIVVVARREDMMLISDVAREFNISKLKSVVTGGASRSESVENGLAALPQTTGYVAIADGARPLITPDIINDTVEQAQKVGGAAAAVPIRDTLKRVSGGKIIQTVDRSSLYAVQTPQVFDIIKYRAARAIASAEEYTDDTKYFEDAGFEVALTEGSASNIKITYSEDIALAESILEKRGY